MPTKTYDNESFISMATSSHTSRDKTLKMELDYMEDSSFFLGHRSPTCGRQSSKPT
jgi:hypothetical protein